MADEPNILGADGKVKQSTLAAGTSESLEVKVLDAGGDLVLSGATSEAVQSALNGFAARGSKIITPVSQVGRRWVAACTTPPVASDLDSTQTLNLVDAVRTFDTDGKRMLSGPTASIVELALKRCVNMGCEVLSPVTRSGAIWLATCTIPEDAAESGTRTSEQGAPPDVNDGCRVESFGLKRIIYGPSKLIVQHRVEQMKRNGAQVVGEVEQEGDQWVAICDTGG